MSFFSDAELTGAIERLLIGDAEPGDGDLLARAMQESPELLREVSGLFVLDDLLRQNEELPAGNFVAAFEERLRDVSDEAFVHRVSRALPDGAGLGKVSRLLRIRWLAMISVVMLGAATLTYSLLLHRVKSRGQIEVATLLLAENCEWQLPRKLQEGQRLTTGQLRLRKGLAVLRFDGGAELILRGETEVQLQSTVQARLIQGAVNVRASEDTAGFELQTPAGDVIDLGTEFAVSVEREGATELHVIEGEVAFSPAGPGQRHQEVLPAGRAVRIDAAKTAIARDVQGNADRFEDVIRAARPAGRAELMRAYEGFSYPSGRLSFSEGNSGQGWRGPWRAPEGDEAYSFRTANDPVTALNIVGGDSDGARLLPGSEQSGRLELPAGTTSIVRTLEHPILLDHDEIYYFSFVVHELDQGDVLIDRRFGGVRLVFRSSESPLNYILSFGPSRLRKPSIRAVNLLSFASPLRIQRNQSTLWVGKIVARSQGEDEVYFSVFGEHEALGYAEPAAWQVATRGVHHDEHLDTVVIAGQLTRPCSVDELRIGPTWRSVAPMWNFSADSKEP